MLLCNKRRRSLPGFAGAAVIGRRGRPARHPLGGGQAADLVAQLLDLAAQGVDFLALGDVQPPQGAAQAFVEGALDPALIERVWGVPARWLGEPGARALAVTGR